MKLPLDLLVALFQIASTIMGAIKEAQWYHEGEQAYAAQQKAIQDDRVRRAREAIGAPDAYSGVGMHDPNELP